MLRNELRRLREEDGARCRERQKRLDLQRKEQIIGKEVQTQCFLDHVRSQEEFFQRKRIQAHINNTLKRNDLQKVVCHFSKSPKKVLTGRNKKVLQKEGVRVQFRRKKSE